MKNSRWLESDDLFNTTGKNSEKFIEGILPTVYPHKNSPLGATTPTLPRLELFTEKNIFHKKPTRMKTTQYPDLFITYREGFNLNTGSRNPIVVDEDLTFSKHSISSPLVFNSVKNTVFLHLRIQIVPEL